MHAKSAAQRMGKLGGGGLLDQSVLRNPAAVSWKEIVPTLSGASGGLPWSSVVHARVKVFARCSLTVTSSFVGVGL